MEFIKNKLYIVLLLICVSLVAWMYWPKAPIAADRLRAWIADGYTQQFCNNIYPKVESCVQFESPECPTVAKEVINACLQSRSEEIVAAKDQLAAKKLYDSFAACFSSSMQATILEQYLVDTPECQDMMR